MDTVTMLFSVLLSPHMARCLARRFGPRWEPNELISLIATELMTKASLPEQGISHPVGYLLQIARRQIWRYDPISHGRTSERGNHPHLTDVDLDSIESSGQRSELFIDKNFLLERFAIDAYERVSPEMRPWLDALRERPNKLHTAMVAKLLGVSLPTARKRIRTELRRLATALNSYKHLIIGNY